MAEKDIRWIQRFNNFSKALNQLTKFIEKGELNELERQGLIQSFEYNYELAWTTLKDYFESQGETNIGRILTSHTYNEDIAEKIAKDTETIYYPEFVKLHAKFETLKKEEE